MFFCESTFKELYDSTVEAFPNTTKRQHATQPIKISNFSITPFVGMKTLFLKAEAVNEDRHYNTMILVKGIKYSPVLTAGFMEVTASDGRVYYLSRPTLENNDILVRCGCADFVWRFAHYDHLDHSLYGKDRKPYIAKVNPGSANPTKSEGLCKHLIRFAEVLRHSHLID